MKPFDLQKALAGEPVVTRDGDKVTEIHNFSTRHGEFTVFAIIEGGFLTFNKNGKHHAEFIDDDFDLFMAEPEQWINLFYNPTQNLVWLGVNRYKTEEEAKEHLTDHKWYQTSIKLKL
jgi:hypothetical protein